MKIIIGAGNTRQDGWTATQEKELNILNRSDFEKILGNNKADAFLAEIDERHVKHDERIALATHFTAVKCALAGPRCFKYKGEWLNDIRHRLGR